MLLESHLGKVVDNEVEKEGAWSTIAGDDVPIVPARSFNYHVPWWLASVLIHSIKPRHNPNARKGTARFARPFSVHIPPELSDYRHCYFRWIFRRLLKVLPCRLYCWSWQRCQERGSSAPHDKRFQWHGSSSKLLPGCVARPPRKALTFKSPLWKIPIFFRHVHFIWHISFPISQLNLAHLDIQIYCLQTEINRHLSVPGMWPCLRFPSLVTDPVYIGTSLPLSHVRVRTKRLEYTIHFLLFSRLISTV